MSQQNPSVPSPSLWTCLEYKYRVVTFPWDLTQDGTGSGVWGGKFLRHTAADTSQAPGFAPWDATYLREAGKH